MASIDLDVRKTWSVFWRAMEQEAKRVPRPSAGRPTMLELHQKQFEWLLSHAAEVSDRHREDPVLVAMYWAHEIGVTPKAMAKVMGAATTGAIRNRLYKFTKRIEGDPELKERLALV